MNNHDDDRVLPLEGVLNFRDFGGYAAAAGPLRRGVLYRSAQFAEASAADIARLDGLGVRHVIDLRRPEERSLSPNRWPGADVSVTVDDSGAAELPPHIAILTRTDLTAAHVTAFMQESYRAYPFEARYVALFKAVFAAIGAGAPVVVHCAAGKDRTGVACALALAALGVSREAIFADYELTNQVVDLAARLPQIQARIEAGLGRALDPEALRPMLGVRVDYLNAAFAAIDEAGGMDDYLTRVLGVDASVRARLLQLLTA